MQWIQLAEAIISIFFYAMDRAGKTEEEQDQFYRDQKARFKARPADALPDPK